MSRVGFPVSGNSTLDIVAWITYLSAEGKRVGHNNKGDADSAKSRTARDARYCQRKAECEGEMPKAGLVPGAVHNPVRVMNQVLVAAVRSRYLRGNLCDGLTREDLPRHRREVVAFLSAPKVVRQPRRSRGSRRSWTGLRGSGPRATDPATAQRVPGGCSASRHRPASALERWGAVKGKWRPTARAGERRGADLHRRYCRFSRRPAEERAVAVVLTTPNITEELRADFEARAERWTTYGPGTTATASAALG